MTRVERQLLENQRVIMSAMLDLPARPRDASRHRLVKACGDTSNLLEKDYDETLTGDDRGS